MQILKTKKGEKNAYIQKTKQKNNNNSPFVSLLPSERKKIQY